MYPRRVTRLATCGTGKGSTHALMATLTRDTGVWTSATVVGRPHWQMACNMKETGWMTRPMGKT